MCCLLILVFIINLCRLIMEVIGLLILIKLFFLIGKVFMILLKGVWIWVLFSKCCIVLSEDCVFVRVVVVLVKVILFCKFLFFSVLVVLNFCCCILSCVFVCFNWVFRLFLLIKVIIWFLVIICFFVIFILVICLVILVLILVCWFGVVCLYSLIILLVWVVLNVW